MLPTVFGGRFSIPETEKAPGKASVYLVDSPIPQLPDGPRYSCLFLWENGVCAFTGAFRQPPTREQIESTGYLVVGRYSLIGKHIVFEEYAFSQNGRIFVIEEGTYFGDTIHIERQRNRNNDEWIQLDDTYSRYRINAGVLRPPVIR